MAHEAALAANGATILRLPTGAPPARVRIDLAETPGFFLGTLRVEPAQLKMSAADGRTERLQPRVMQVLVALASANGAIVSRDSLIESCWDGRIVGEDAITRVIVKLRHLADGIGAGAFAIETVSKIGYRLERLAPDATAPEAAAGGLGVSRRWAVAGASAAAVAAAGFIWARPFLQRAQQADSPGTAEAALAFQNGLAAMRRATPEADREAVGLFRRATALRPDYADAWGALSLAYASTYWDTDAPDTSLELAHSAADHARTIEPGNGYAAMEQAWSRPFMGNWLLYERVLRQVIKAEPDIDIAYMSLGNLLGLVGRHGEATRTAMEALRLAPAGPLNYVLCVTGLTSANLLDEAERLLVRAYELFPTYPLLWIVRFRLCLTSARFDDAIAFAERVDLRPAGEPDEVFQFHLTVARALQSRSPAAVNAARDMIMDRAHRSVSGCQFAIEYASALGRLDDAFAAAEALYLTRGFDPGEQRSRPDQHAIVRRPDRRTYVLFMPGTSAMRADPRFVRLTEEVGLERYWRESGSQPDYRKT